MRVESIAVARDISVRAAAYVLEIVLLLLFADVLPSLAFRNAPRILARRCRLSSHLQAYAAVFLPLLFF